MVTAGLMVSPPEKCRVAKQPRSAFGDYADWLKPVTLFVQPVDLQAPPLFCHTLLLTGMQKTRLIHLGVWVGQIADIAAKATKGLAFDVSTLLGMTCLFPFSTKIEISSHKVENLRR